MKDKQYEVPAAPLAEISTYFSDLMINYKEQMIKIIMPGWVTEFSMNVLLNFVPPNDLLPSYMTDEESLKTLWLADFLKVKDLVEICI